MRFPARTNVSSGSSTPPGSNGEAHVEVFALDALARIAAEAGDMETAHDLCESADRRMEAASHFITELDRTDAHQIRHAR